MSPWVLILLLTTGDGRGGVAVHSEPFATRMACEIARDELKRMAPEDSRFLSEPHLRAVCVATDEKFR